MRKMVKNFSKNKYQEIRVGITEYEGINLIDIRTWAKVPGSDEMRPTAKGISINVQLYPELKEAVLELEKELKANGLLNSDG